MNIKSILDQMDKGRLFVVDFARQASETLHVHSSKE
jgi:hypothetical protein